MSFGILNIVHVLDNSPSPLTFITGKPDVYYSVGWPLYNCTFVNMVKDWREKFASASECSHCTYPFGFVQVTVHSTHKEICK